MTESDLIVVVEIVVFVIFISQTRPDNVQLCKTQIQEHEVWSKTSYSGDLTDAGRQTPEQGKIGQGYSADGCWMADFRNFGVNFGIAGCSNT